MVSIRFIDASKGARKFGGDKKQYASMVSLFDSITLDESLLQIYKHILASGKTPNQQQTSNLLAAIRETKNLQTSALTIEALGLAYHCNELVQQLQAMQNKFDLDFHALVVFEQFVGLIIEFKEEIAKLSQNTSQSLAKNNANVIAALQLQQDIRMTLHGYNQQQQEQYQQQQVQQQYQSFDNQKYADFEQQENEPNQANRNNNNIYPQTALIEPSQNALLNHSRLIVSQYTSQQTYSPNRAINYKSYQEQPQEQQQVHPYFDDVESKKERIVFENEDQENQNPVNCNCAIF